MTDGSPNGRPAGVQPNIDIDKKLRAHVAKLNREAELERSHLRYRSVELDDAYGNPRGRR